MISTHNLISLNEFLDKIESYAFARDIGMSSDFLLRDILDRYTSAEISRIRDEIEREILSR